MVGQGMDPKQVERVQLGVRMEKRIVKVLKGLAEYSNMTLGQLLEKIVLHSFEPEPGQEGEWCASPYSKRSLSVIADLKRIYGLNDEVHASRSFEESSSSGDR
jgi:hypothetical protein